jgi:ADP-ribosylglycohydrolase
MIDRILGCLQGIATGDAIGKQTETLSREKVSQWYPDGIRGFEGRPGDVIPRYVRNSKREWRIGETTDDTERTIAVARAIISDRRISHVSIGREMLRCTKSVHPGVRSLWEFHQAGDPWRMATEHDGCGAAVRVAPVGIFLVSNRGDDIIRGAREASISTHGGSLAIAAAAATAAAVSAALDGASPDQTIESAGRAAAAAEEQWPGRGAPSFAKAVEGVFEDLKNQPRMQPADVAERHFPNHPLKIVPLALAIAALFESARDAILFAANVGGDSDSVASIAGGILGAMRPDTVDDQWCATVEAVNALDLAAIAKELAPLRH